MGHPKQKPKSECHHPPKPNEISLRIAFLQQAAKIMAEKSQATNDTPSKLSKLYMEELQEIRNIQQSLLSKDFRRSYCRGCNRIWVPNQTGDNGIDVKITKRKVHRQCKDCGSSASFARNPNYKSRNEKT